jgi:hypothetical protein
LYIYGVVADAARTLHQRRPVVHATVSGGALVLLVAEACVLTKVVEILAS